MSDNVKCGTGCITPSVCHAHYCNRVTPPTPDPRERGEVDHADAERVARAIASGPDGAGYSAHRVLARAYLALRAPAPSEAVARDPISYEASQWRKLEHMALAVRQGDADENAVVAWMWDALGVKLAFAPARGVTVTEAMLLNEAADAVSYFASTADEPEMIRVQYHHLAARLRAAALTPDAKGGR